jgi:hypothetical protein
VIFEAMVNELELKSSSREEILNKISQILQRVKPTNQGRKVIMKAFIYFVIEHCRHVENIASSLTNVFDVWNGI